MKECKSCILCEHSVYECHPDFDNRLHLFCQLKNRITFDTNTCEFFEYDKGGEPFEGSHN